MVNRTLPTNVHKLRGTYREHRHKNDGEALIPPDYPKAPQYVIDFPGAIDVWNQLEVSMLEADIYTLADSNKMARYCILEAEFRSNPIAFSESAARLTQLRLLENDLYLSPESRAKICGKKNEQANRFSDF